MRLIKVTKRLRQGIVVLCATATMGFACEIPEGAQDLVVAYRSAEPFTFSGQDNMPRGFAVDLWHSVSTDLDRATTFVECESIDEQELALQNGSVDVVISPLTITAERMRRYDFSQQYLSSGLTLAVAQTGAIDFETAIETIMDTVFQPTVARAILLFLILNLITALLLRAMMRNRPIEVSSSGAGPIRTWMAYTLEAVARTMGLKGVGDGFGTLVGKVFEIFMAVVGTALSAMILGVITSAFVGAIGESPPIAANGLPGKRIATLRCSTAQEFLREQYKEAAARADGKNQKRHIYQQRADWLVCDPVRDNSETIRDLDADTLKGGVILTGTWDEAVEQLFQGKVDAVLGDWVALSYLSRRAPYEGHLTVQNNVYRNEPYGWAISRAKDTSELRRAIDRALIIRMRDTEWRKRIENTLGSGSIAPN